MNVELAAVGLALVGAAELGGAPPGSARASRGDRLLELGGDGDERAARGERDRELAHVGAVARERRLACALEREQDRLAARPPGCRRGRRRSSCRSGTAAARPGARGGSRRARARRRRRGSARRTRARGGSRRRPAGRTPRTSSVCQRIVISSASSPSSSARSARLDPRLVEAGEDRRRCGRGRAAACAGSPRSGARSGRARARRRRAGARARRRAPPPAARRPPRATRAARAPRRRTRAGGAADGAARRCWRAGSRARRRAARAPARRGRARARPRARSPGRRSRASAAPRRGRAPRRRGTPRPPARRARRRAASRAGGRRAAAGRRALRCGPGRACGRVSLRLAPRDAGPRRRAASRRSGGQRRHMLSARGRPTAAARSLPMTDPSSQHSGAAAAGPALRAGRAVAAAVLSVALWVFVVGNGVGVVWIWALGGEDGIGYHWHSFDQASCSALGRITAFLAGYLALIEVILLARLPFLERLVGFDRLTFWHRWNGHAVHRPRARPRRLLGLGLRQAVDDNSWFQEYWNWLTLPQTDLGELDATGALNLKPGGSLSITTLAPDDLALPGDHHRDGRHRSCWSSVLVTSLVVVRRKLSYEWWYAVHFTAYAGHRARLVPHDPRRQRPPHQPGRRPTTGAASTRCALALVLYYRLLRPLARAFRYDMRVTEVVEEGPGRRLAADRRPRPRAARRAGGPVLLLALPHPGLLVHAAPLLALGGARRRLVPDHGQEPRRPHRPLRPRSRSGRASTPRAPSASSPTRAASRTRRC